MGTRAPDGEVAELVTIPASNGKPRRSSSSTSSIRSSTEVLEVTIPATREMTSTASLLSGMPCQGGMAAMRHLPSDDEHQATAWCSSFDPRYRDSTQKPHAGSGSVLKERSAQRRGARVPGAGPGGGG